MMLHNEPEGEQTGRSKIETVTRALVRESVLPTEKGLGYQSTVGIFGGKLTWEADNQLVLDWEGPVSKLDQAGDPRLRAVDEHFAKHPGKLFRRILRQIFIPREKKLYSLGKYLTARPMRQRGNKQEVLANVLRLGLTEYYMAHKRGFTIEPSIYTRSIPLQDIFRQDMINSDVLNGIDRFEALRVASQYIGSVHADYGAIGEILPNDILFREHDDHQVASPILNIPDIIYNPDSTEVSKMATDVLDLLFTIGLEEVRRTKSDQGSEQIEANLARCIQIIINEYGAGLKGQDEGKRDLYQKVLKTIMSFIKRGRMTTVGNAEFMKDDLKPSQKLTEIFSVHNKERLQNYDKEYLPLLRTLIVTTARDRLDELLPQSQN